MRPLLTTSYAVAEAHVSPPKPDLRSIETDDTLPAPAAVCSCGRPYSQADFDALPLGAGHHGDPSPVDGLTVRICRACGSSVSTLEEWPWDALQYESAPDLDDVVGFDVTVRADGDPWEERDSLTEQRRNQRMIWRGP